nr:immunoglobulin light chain junction region [Macaca mulatta]
CMQGVQIPLTF